MLTVSDNYILYLRITSVLTLWQVEVPVRLGGAEGAG